MGRKYLTKMLDEAVDYDEGALGVMPTPEWLPKSLHTPRSITAAKLLDTGHSTTRVAVLTKYPMRLIATVNRARERRLLKKCRGMVNL